MVCKPCRYGDHEQCPEAARQGNTALSLAERSASSRCDCVHQPRTVRSATQSQPATPPQ